MNTKHAESESAIERLRSDMADWKTEVVRTIYAAMGVGIALLGALIALLD